MSAIGAGSQVSSLRDLGESELQPARKLKHTVNKVLSLRDKKDMAIDMKQRSAVANALTGKICANPFNLCYLR